MHAILCFASEGVIRDTQTNNISAFNILEQISSPGFPLFMQKMFFFCLLEREEGDPATVELRVIASNNDQTIVEVGSTVNFQEKNRNRLIIQIGGLAIPSPGKLVFTLKKDEELLCSYSVEIKKIGEPEVKTVESNT